MESVAGAQTIYATDVESGGLYATQDDGRSSWGPETFRPVWVDPAYSGPAALTPAPGGVVVAYQEPPAVVFVSPSGETSVLWQGPPLERPSAVAVLDPDRLIVSDARLSGLLLLQRVKGEGEGETFWRIEWRTVEGTPIEGARRLVASRGELLVLSPAAEGIVSVRAEAGKVWRAQSLERSPRDRLLENVVNARDFAFHRGVFYVTDEQQLEVFTRTEQGSHLVPFASPQAAFSRLVAGPDDLFVLDSASGVIRRWPRPVPSVVKLEDDAQGATRDLALLLHSLVCQDLIVARDFTVKAPATVQEVLALRNLWPGRRGEGASLSGGPRAPSPRRSAGCREPVGETAEKIYAEIFCLLNPGLCTEGAEAPARAILSIPLQAGQHVSLPDLEVQSYLTSRWLHLGRRPVSQHLDEKILSPDLRAQVDAAYISRINGASFRTPESVLTRAGFTQATPPRGDLEPGTILRYDRKNAEVVVSHLKTCMPALQVLLSEEMPVRLPRPLVAKLPSRLVPGGEESDGRLAAWGVATVEMTFDETVAEKIDTSGVERLDTPGCPEMERGASHYLVLEALRARGARYRFLREDGSVLYPSPEQLAETGFGGRSGESEGWSLVVDWDLYLGYRRVPWEPAPRQGMQASWNATADLMVKENSSQDILAHSGSNLNLPVEAWRTKVLLPAPMLKGAGLLVPEWTDGSSRVHLLSTEDLPPLEAHSTVLREAPDDDPPAAMASARATQIWDELTNNRERLCKEIGYSRELVNDLYGVVVGVAEELGNLDIDHPDFLGDDGSSVWTEIGEDGQIRPMTRSTIRVVPEAQVRDPAKTDHGTHVAGLIGSRRGRLGPGLLPHGELLLLDTSNVSRFHDALRVADARGEVGVMNFSFSYKLADAPEQLLPIMKGAQNLLFVVAAGNDAMELGGHQRFPVCWGTEVPHLIGVGASKWDKQFLDGWVGADGRVYGSNYGPRFVHILAPGFEIYSLAGDNGYTKETGTSQAAPLVAATAAALAQKLIPPLRIKARLIYTADWYPYLETRASGGFLNVRRALWQPELNLVWTQGEETIPKSIHYKRNPEMITLRGGEFRDQRGERFNVVRPVAFRNVLRITLTEGGFFRVIYLEEGSRHLRILVGTTVEGTLQCDRFQRWDGVKFVDAPAECSGEGFDVTSIQDYVAKIPPTVTF